MKVLIYFLTLTIHSLLQSLTTSVIVPCYYRHFCYLNDLLDAYDHQTVLPDEIVIAISEAHHIPKEDIERLIHSQHLYKLKVLLTEEIQLAAPNRNRAIRASYGDLLFFQDADDLPFPQRIEVGKRIFQSHPEIKMLRHEIVQKPELICRYRIERLICKKEMTISHIDFGHPIVHRSVFEEVMFPEIPQVEDYHFVQEVVKRFGMQYILCVPLYLWNVDRSAWRYQELRDRYFPNSHPHGHGNIDPLF